MKTEEQAIALRVRCPICLAQPGFPCITKLRQARQRGAHPERVAAAAENPPDDISLSNPPPITAAEIRRELADIRTKLTSTSEGTRRDTMRRLQRLQDRLDDHQPDTGDHVFL